MVKQRGFHWAWVVLAVCFGDLFVNYSIRLGYSVVLPEMIRDLGISRTDAGTIFNAYLLMYVALTPLTGYLTDRIGARRVIAACALVLGTGSILMGTINSLFWACVFYGVAGLGSTGMWAPIVTVVQRWFAVRRRGMALGVLSTGFGLGFATMGLVFPAIVRHFNWRFAWYFLGGAALVMVAVNGLLLRSDPDSAGYRPWGETGDDKPSTADAAAKAARPPASVAFRQGAFWLIGASYFCIAYCVYGFSTFMIDYARYQLGWPLEQASFLATISGFGQVAGVLIILPLSDYLGRKKTILLAHLFMALSLAGLLLAGGDWKLVYPLAGLMAVFGGAIFPLYGACAGDYFPPAIMGTVMGAWTPFYGLGAVVVHWVTGALRDARGDYDLAFTIAVSAAVLAFLFMLPVRGRVEG
ncbi:MAG: MFS transporter [Proteobacteria bacterium]|nr:MFS transporter [Pseudomonadota bacterium]